MLFKNSTLGSDVEAQGPCVLQYAPLKNMLGRNDCSKGREVHQRQDVLCSLCTFLNKMISSLLWGKLADLVALDALKVFAMLSSGKGQGEAAEGESY